MTNFIQNLEWLRRRAGLDKTQFASEFVIERSNFSRLLSGERAPSPAQLLVIAKYYNLEVDDFLLPHSEFLGRFNTINSNLPLISFRTIRSHSTRLRSVFETYRGQYNVYYKRTSNPANNQQRVNGSLLEIRRLSGDAIQFEFINPTRLRTGAWTAYEYTGFAFPVGDTLYLLGEQNEREYEIMSMLVHMSRAPSISILKGLVTAIAVTNEGGIEKGHIMARQIVLNKRRTRLENWHLALDKELGYLSESQLPLVVLQELTDQRIDIE